jgi:hypothetical protein
MWTPYGSLNASLAPHLSIVAAIVIAVHGHAAHHGSRHDPLPTIVEG